MSIQNQYETVLIFSVKNSEDEAKNLLQRFKSMIEENGTLDSVDEWGKRRLAYPINDETEGYYALVNYTAAPEFPAELDRVLKITDGVLRSLIVKKGN